MSLDGWRSVITSVYQKRARKHWKTVAMDLIAVGCGIKPAFLFDQWFSSPEEIVQLLQLAYDKGLTLVKLDLIVITTDLLVYCKDFILDVEHICPKFIDVSWSLEKPELITEEKVNSTMRSFRDFLEFVRKSLSNSDDQTSSSSNPENLWYEVDVNDSVNPSCLFGLFLGYPLVYWFDHSKSEDNCLSMQLLKLYQVKGLPIKSDCSGHKHKIPTNSSSPLSVVEQERKEQNSVSQEKSLEGYGSTCDLEYILYSFSVPVDIVNSDSKLKDVVEEWFSRWKNSEKLTNSFLHVWLEQSEVVLPIVSL